MQNITITTATPNDALELLQIYSYYVENTAISFELISPSLQEFTERIKNTLKKFPYLVAKKGDKIVGYAYASQFRTRAAYSHCADLSIYIEKTERKQGIGRTLYEELQSRLQQQGIKNLYAGVTFPHSVNEIPQSEEYLDTSSFEFHKKMGFSKVGHFNLCGKKVQQTLRFSYNGKVDYIKKCRTYRLGIFSAYFFLITFYTKTMNI